MALSFVTEVRIDSAAIARLTQGGGMVYAFINRLGRETENAAKGYVPVRTGRLRASLSTTMSADGDQAEALVGSNVHYARYVDEGTGVYGPRGQMIRPVNGRYLVFTGSDGATVFAREVAGSRPTRFLTRAFEETMRAHGL